MKHERRTVSRKWKPLLRIIYRYSGTRDAYVLRLVGSKLRFGPVIRFD